MDVQTARVNALIRQHDSQKKALIAILQDIQAEYRYLPPDALRAVARALKIPLIDVIGVATFYRAFSLKPRGKHLVQVCLGTACHVRGGELVYERAQTDAKVGPGGTSADMLFTVEPVRCLGCCGLAPVMRVDRDTFAHLEQAKVRGILNRYHPRKKPANVEKVAASAEAVRL